MGVRVMPPPGPSRAPASAPACPAPQHAPSPARRMPQAHAHRGPRSLVTETSHVQSKDGRSSNERAAGARQLPANEGCIPDTASGTVCSPETLGSRRRPAPAPPRPLRAAPCADASSGPDAGGPAAGAPDGP